MALENIFLNGFIADIEVPWPRMHKDMDHMALNTTHAAATAHDHLLASHNSQAINTLEISPHRLRPQLNSLQSHYSDSGCIRESLVVHTVYKLLYKQLYNLRI